METLIAALSYHVSHASLVMLLVRLMWIDELVHSCTWLQRGDAFSELINHTLVPYQPVRGEGEENLAPFTVSMSSEKMCWCCMVDVYPPIFVLNVKSYLILPVSDGILHLKYSLDCG